jgi:hypothetical protein
MYFYMVLFKKIVENYIIKLKQYESYGFQVPVSNDISKIMSLQIIIAAPKHKIIEVSSWHSEQGTWNFLGETINQHYFKTEPFIFSSSASNEDFNFIMVNNFFRQATAVSVNKLYLQW